MPDYDLKTILRGWFVGNERFGERYGFLGKIVSGSYEVETGDGRVWVTLDEGTPIKAINKKVVRKPGIKVIVKPNRDGEMEIQGINTAQMLAATSNNAASIATLEGSGSHRHFIGSGNEDPVESRRFTPGLLRAFSGLTVYIESFPFRHNGIDYRWPGGTYDLTGDLPVTSGYWGWVKVGIDPATNTAVADVSAEVPLRSLLTLATLDAIDFATADYIPCGGVIVQEGQTAGPLEADFAEARFMPSSGGAGGSGDVTGPASSTDNAIARFDGTTGKIIQNSATTIDDNGALTNAGPVTIDGDTDAVQLTVQAHSSQSANLQVWEDSSAVDLMTIANTGDIIPGTDVLRSLGTSSKRFFDGYIRALLGDVQAFRVRNGSGATANAGDVGYLDYDSTYGQVYKTTTTANLSTVRWCAVAVGGADTADIYVTTRGRIALNYAGSAPSAGQLLATSTTAGKVAARSLMHPGVMAQATAAGSGGTVAAILLCETQDITFTDSEDIFAAAVVSDTVFTGTINGAPSTTNVTVTTTTGAVANFRPIVTTQIFKPLLWNTTRGTARRVTNCAAPNVTTEATTDAWASGDALNIESQVVNNGLGYKFIDLERSNYNVVPKLARAIITNMSVNDSSTTAPGLGFMHPYTTYANSRLNAEYSIAITNTYNVKGAPAIELIDERFCWAFDATGSGTGNIYIRLAGYKLAVP